MTELARELLVASGLYVVVLLAVGAFGRRARQSDTMSDHFLAGRSIGFFVLLLTLFATQYSGNSLSGFPGKTYRSGLAYIMSVTFMVSIVTGYLLFAPKLFRLARERNYLTPTDFLADRFGSPTLNVVSAAIFIFALGNFLLAQLTALGHAFSGLTDGALSYEKAILIGAGVILAYELLGGMRAVAWTDAVQGVLLVGGLTVVAFLVSRDVGNPVSLLGKLAEIHPAKVAPPDARGCWTWIGNFMLLGFGAPLYPQAIQRIYAARHVRELRRALATMSILPLWAITTVIYIGLAGILLFPELDRIQSDQVTFLVLGHVLETAPGAQFAVLLVMLAVLAAIMSTADSCLLSLSAILSRDVLARMRSIPRERVDSFTRWNPLISLGVIGLIAALAVQPRTTLWGLLVLKFEILIQLSPAFVLGSRSPDGVGSRAIVAGLLTGLSIFAVLFAMGRRDLGGFHVGSFALIVNYSVVWMLSRPRR